MTTRLRLRATALAFALFASAPGFSLAQTSSGDPHHPAGETSGTSAPDQKTTGAPGSTPGTGEPMMGMMDNMMRMMGGAAGQVAGPGMMMPQMMMAMCPMMQAMMSQGQMGQGRMAQNMMPGLMAGSAIGPAIIYGMPQGSQTELSVERVRAWLEQQLGAHGNSRLKVGDVKQTNDTTITAEIVTVDGSLVQKLAFNRYPGLARQVP